MTNDRLTNLYFVICKVFHGHVAAPSRNSIYHSLCHIAGIESIFTAISDQLQGLCQIRVFDHIANLIRQSALIQVDIAQSLVCGNTGILAVQLFLKGNSHYIAVVGSVDSRLEDLLTAYGIRTVVIKKILKTSNFSRYSYRQTADHALVTQIIHAVQTELLHLSVFIQPHLCISSCRSSLTEIKDTHLVIFGTVNSHKSAAAQTGEVRLSHAQSVGYSSRCVKGVSAFLQNFQTCLAGVPVTGSNRAVFTGSVTVITLLLEVFVVRQPDILTNVFGRRSSFCFGSCLGSSLTARRCRCR